MELANKGFAQLAESFGSMTPAARVTAALLLVVTVVSAAYLFNTQASGAQVYLMGEESFSAAELRDMQAAFGKAGLEAQIDGARIKIPHGQESKYMAALADADALPTDFGHHMQQAVNASGFLRIPHGQQEAAWRVATQQDLQRAIGQMRGIDRAFVRIDEEQTDGFPHAKKSVTAAVMVLPNSDGPLDAHTVRTIQEIMASSVSGLGNDAVTVVDMSTNDTYRAADGDNASGGSHEKQKIERLVGDSLPRNEAGTASGQQVAVSTSYRVEESATAQQREPRERALAWAIGNWRTLSLGGLAVVGLVVFGSLVRSISGAPKRPATETTELPPTLSLVDDRFESSPAVAASERFDPRALGSSSLTGELADAVRDDPDAAVSVLRTWIGNAS